MAAGPMLILTPGFGSPSSLAEVSGMYALSR